jgi:predicted amidohydrolase YtcJ
MLKASEMMTSHSVLNRRPGSSEAALDSFDQGRRLMLQGAAGAAVAGFSQAAWAAAETADVILTNARIWTGDRVNPQAEVVAIAGDRIVAVGSASAVRRYSGRSTRTVDLKRRFVMPGFNDSHVHFTGMSNDYTNVSLLGTKAIDEVLARLKERVQQTPPGQWVVARSQWHEALLREGRMPTRKELDAISPDNPIYIPRGGHVAAVNSKALELAGVTRATPNPPGGIIVRDADGEPTGLMLERARAVFAGLVPTLGAEAYMQNMRRLMAELNAYGLTTLTNPSTADAAIVAMERLSGGGLSTLRINWTANINTAQAVRELRQRRAPFQGDDMLRFSGIGEPGIDGGIEGAYLREPYQLVPGDQDDPSYRGVLMPWPRDRDAFIQFYLAAIAAGYNVMTHVTGDAALDVALDALAEVERTASYRRLRWTLHGCFLTDDAQLARIKQLGLYISAQAQPYLLGVQMAKWWGKARADRSIPVGAFVEAGVPVAAGSDASAGIANPLESMGWMVNRLCLGGYQMDKRWSAPAEVVMRLYTAASAETQFMEDKIGVLKRGMLADLAILEESPLVVGVSEINGIKADATIVGGRVVFDRHRLFA